MSYILMIGFVGAAMTAGAEAVGGPGLAQWIPNEVRGWKPKQADGVYTSANLYDYIDGAAEIYRSFNVTRAVARRYAKPGAADLIAEIYDMGSSSDAFGVYHHQLRPGASAGIGQESAHQVGALFFWKGPYFVSVQAMDETEDANQAVLAIGKAIARGIPREGAKPDLLKRLPQDGLLSGQIHYFHDNFCLNTYYFVADENVLDLGRETDVVLTRYASGDNPSATDSLVLVVIHYPSLERARKALAVFVKAYLAAADTQGIAETKNGKWAGAQCSEREIVAVFNAPSHSEIVRRFNEIVKPPP